MSDNKSNLNLKGFFSPPKTLPKSFFSGVQPKPTVVPQETIVEPEKEKDLNTLFGQPISQRDLRNIQKTNQPTISDELKEKEEPKQFTEDELRKNNTFINSAKKIYAYEKGEDWTIEDGTTDDLATWLLNRHTKLGNNYTSLGVTAYDAKRNMPEDVQKAWADSIEQYENSDWTMRGFLRGAFWSVVDLPTLLTLGTAGLVAKFGSKVAGGIARNSFKELLKKEITKKSAAKKSKALSQKQFKEASKKIGRQKAKQHAYVGMPAGAAYSGIYDIMYQDFKGTVDPDYEYDKIQTLIATGLGAFIGGAPAAFTLGSEKLLRNKRAKQFLDEEELVLTNIKDLEQKSNKAKKNAGVSSVIDEDLEAQLAQNQTIKGDVKPHRQLYKTLKEDIKIEKRINGEEQAKNKNRKILLWGPGKHIGAVRKTDKGNEIDDAGIPLTEGKGNEQKDIYIPYNDVPERRLVDNKIIKNIVKDEELNTSPKISMYELETIRNKAPKSNIYIDESGLVKGDQDYILAGNWMGKLKPNQARYEIDRIAETLNSKGTLIINTGEPKKVKLKGKTEYVPVAQEERKGWLQDRNNQRSDFIEKITATSDGFKIDKYKPLGITNKELNRQLKQMFKYVKEEEGGVFVAKGKYGPKNPNVTNRTTTSTTHTFKPVATVGPKNISWFDEWFSQTAGLPTEIHGARIAKNAVGEIIKRPLKRKIDTYNKLKETIKTKDGRTYNKMTELEQDYVNAISDMILRGKRTLFTNPIDANNISRLSHMINLNKVQPEFSRFTEDPIGVIPQKFIKNLFEMRKDINRIQEQSIKVGLIEKGSDLHATILNSMGKGQKTGEANLHLNRQYEIHDNASWRSRIYKDYPERIVKAKRFFTDMLETADDSLVGSYQPAEFAREIQKAIDLRTRGGFPTELDPIKRISNVELGLRGQARNIEIKLEKDLNVPVIKNMDDLKKVQKDYMDKEADRLVESFLDKHAADEISLLKTLGGDDPALDTSSLYFKDIDNLKGGNTGNAATRATFYKRGELPPEIRSLLGEYRTPDKNYVNTLYKLMENVENFKYETKVTALAKEGQLPNVLIKPVNLTTGKQGDIPAGYEPLSNISELPKYTEGINIPSRKKEGRNIIEIYAPTEIVKAIKEGNSYSKEITNPALKTLMGLQAFSRMNVTALRLAGYPRNFFGAALKSLGSGNFSVSALKEANKVFTGLSKFNDIELNNFMQRQSRMGLLGQSTRTQDLRAQFADAGLDPMSGFNMNNIVKGDKNKTTLEKLKSTAERGQQWILDRYQLMDDYWRTYNFFAERKRYAKILQDDPTILGKYTNLEDATRAGKSLNDPIEPDDIADEFIGDGGVPITISHLDNYAAGKVRAHMDNYGELAKAFKLARRLPMADFLGYKAEQVRTTKNIFGTAIHDIKRGIKLQSDSNGELGAAQYNAGLQRLGSIIAALGIGPTLVGTMTYAYLKNDEDFKENTIIAGGKEFKNLYSFEEGMRIIGMPDYAQGDMNIPMSRKDPETGKFRVFNWSRLDTWGPITTTVNSILNNFYQDDVSLQGSIKAGANAARVKIIEELGPTMVLKAALNVLEGKDEYGRKVADIGDPSYINYTKALTSAAYSLLMPGTLVDIDNVRKALNEYEAATDTDPKRKSLSEKGGFSRDPFTEIIKTTGVPLGFVEPMLSFRYKIAPDLKLIKGANSIFKQELDKFTKLDKDTIKKAYRKALETDQAARNSLILKFIAAKAAGLTDRQITNSITRDRNIPAEFNTIIKSAQQLPRYYVVPANLQPSTKGIRTTLNNIAARTQRDTGFYKEILPELEQIQKDFNNNNEYNYYKQLQEPGEKDFDLRLY
jgi:hypothetical protein